MPGLDPGIHALLLRDYKDVDGRVKPGHDDGETSAPTSGTVKCDSPAHAPGAFWIRVMNIDALYPEYLAANVMTSSQVRMNIDALYPEYLAANVMTSSQVRAKPWGFREFHICDRSRTGRGYPGDVQKCQV
jgi:hypothetical protein